ncbi:MAG: hypothetical protein JSV96_00830 [Candidatus Aminicenantes bacterium]|nr:MAG: hypothetical protein JSV96_00830 [Candidatus Aminicenantes bacterium]
MDGLFNTSAGNVSISKSVMVLKQWGKLMRKSSGGERAWFLKEESEPRTAKKKGTGYFFPLPLGLDSSSPLFCHCEE